jgi:hypothetical protein
MLYHIIKYTGLWETKIPPLLGEERGVPFKFSNNLAVKILHNNYNSTLIYRVLLQ